MSSDVPNSRGLYRKTFYYQGIRYDITAKSHDALIRKVLERQIALESGNIIINKNTTVSRWCDEWLEVYKKPNISDNYFNQIESIFRLYIKPEIGSLKLVDVKKINLQRILNEHSGKSFSQLSRIRSCLYELFNTALDEDLILKNPANKLILPSYTKGERKILTDEEYTSCFNVANTHPAGIWVIMMLTCGLRPQETVPLLWSDIDLNERLISINKAANFSSNQPVFKDTKTVAGNRIVPIRNELLDLLNKSERKSVYVFSKEDGLPITKTKMKRMWSSFLRALDIYMGAELYRNAIIKSKLQDGLTPYCCRHTCITRLVLDGVDIKTVMTFAGHEKVETTLKFYTHLGKEQSAKRLLDFHSNVTDSTS